MIQFIRLSPNQIGRGLAAVCRHFYSTIDIHRGSFSFFGSFFAEKSMGSTQTGSRVPRQMVGNICGLPKSSHSATDARRRRCCRRYQLHTGFETSGVVKIASQLRER